MAVPEQKPIRLEDVEHARLASVKEVEDPELRDELFMTLEDEELEDQLEAQTGPANE